MTLRRSRSRAYADLFYNNPVWLEVDEVAAKMATVVTRYATGAQRVSLLAEVDKLRKLLKRELEK